MDCLTIFAYIDPATGSFILQLLVGVIASMWLVLKLWGRRIRAFFGKGDKTPGNT